MLTPTGAKDLSKEVEKQYEAISEEITEAIEKWWPDEINFRRAGKTPVPLEFSLETDRLPGTIGLLLLELRKHRWETRYLDQSSIIIIYGQAKAEFRDVNQVLKNVQEQATFYLMQHDECYKQYCLQSAAWDAVDELSDMVADLDEPLRSPVQSFVDTCMKAKLKGQHDNIKRENFSLAGLEIIKLMETIETIDDPSLRIGISKDNLASLICFQNLQEYANHFKEEQGKKIEANQTKKADD